MIRKLLLLVSHLLTLTVSVDPPCVQVDPGVLSRTLNVVLSHNQNYVVEERDVLSFIPLDPRAERQLNLPSPYVNEQQVEQNVPDVENTHGGGSYIDASVVADGIDPPRRRETHTVKHTDDDIDDKDADNAESDVPPDGDTGTDVDTDIDADDESLAVRRRPEDMQVLRNQFIPKHLRVGDVLKDDLTLSGALSPGEYRRTNTDDLPLSGTLSQREHRRVNIDDMALNSGLTRDEHRRTSIEDMTLGGALSRGKHRRTKRAAVEQWRSGVSGNQYPGGSADDKKEPIVWEAVTDEELKHGKHQKYYEIAEYVGITLLSVAGFVFVGICFMRDPVMCIFAFGTGCPCCLLCCPCVRAFTDKYLDTKRLVKDSMNKYMPGVIVKEDGTMDYYEPTPDEVMILHEILEEITG